MWKPCSWHWIWLFKIFNPPKHAGGCPKMINITQTSRQPAWLPWAMDHLIHKWSILLGMAINNSTANTYTSTTDSYLMFCKLHNLTIDPTPKTLSYYITFQATISTQNRLSPTSLESVAILGLFFLMSAPIKPVRLSSEPLKELSVVMVDHPNRSHLWQPLNYKLLPANSSILMITMTCYFFACSIPVFWDFFVLEKWLLVIICTFRTFEKSFCTTPLHG